MAIYNPTALRTELRRHAAAVSAGDTSAAWTALERAHILSQPRLVPHLRVHVAMLRHAIATRDLHETLGQLARIILAPFGAATGRIPAGNTGRANVSAFRPMPIPADLRAALGHESR